MPVSPPQLSPRRSVQPCPGKNLPVFAFPTGMGPHYIRATSFFSFSTVSVRPDCDCPPSSLAFSCAFHAYPSPGFFQVSPFNRSKCCKNPPPPEAFFLFPQPVLWCRRPLFLFGASPLLSKSHPENFLSGSALTPLPPPFQTATNFLICFFSLTSFFPFLFESRIFLK